MNESESLVGRHLPGCAQFGKWLSVDISIVVNGPPIPPSDLFFVRQFYIVSSWHTVPTQSVDRYIRICPCVMTLSRLQAGFRVLMWLKRNRGFDIVAVQFSGQYIWYLSDRLIPGPKCRAKWSLYLTL